MDAERGEPVEEGPPPQEGLLLLVPLVLGLSKVRRGQGVGTPLFAACVRCPLHACCVFCALHGCALLFWSARCAHYEERPREARSGPASPCLGRSSGLASPFCLRSFPGALPRPPRPPQLNPVYGPQLQAVLRFPQSVGIVGGRPGSSLYFVGHQGESVLYLDPHHLQPVGGKAGSAQGSCMPGAQSAGCAAKQLCPCRGLTWPGLAWGQGWASL